MAPIDLPAGVQQTLDTAMQAQPQTTLPKADIPAENAGQYLAAASAPRVPAGQAPEPADEGDEQPTISGADMLAGMFFKHLLTKDQQANQPAPPPGSFGAKLAGAVSGIGGAVGNALGDAAAAGKGPGGWLAGVERTTAAHQARVAQEKQQAFENTERKRMDDINYAHAQVQTLLAQQNLRHVDQEDKMKALDFNKNLGASLEDAGAAKIKSGLSPDQLKTWRMDPANKDVATDATAVVDHYEMDENGFGVPVYNIYGKVPERDLSTEDAAYLNKWGQAGANYQEGSKVPGSAFVRQMQEAHARETADLNRQKIVAGIFKDDAEAKKANEEAVEKKERDQLGGEISGGMATFGWNPLKALDRVRDIENSSQATPEAKQQATDFGEKVTKFFGGDAIARLQETDTLAALKRAEMENNKSDKKLDANQMKGKTYITKAMDDYGKSAGENWTALTSISKAKSGSELDSSMVPLFTALGISTAAGVRRINQTEVDQAGPRVGSLYRRAVNLIDKIGTGTISEDQLKEAEGIAHELQDAAYNKYIRSAIVNQHNYDVPDDFMVLDRTGRGQQTLGAAKLEVARGDAEFAIKNGQNPPEGMQIKVDPQGKKPSIFSNDNGKTWFNVQSGQQIQ